MSDFVEIDGVRLEWAWHGPSPDRAPTIVFLHEGLGSIAQWRDFPPALCSRTECGGLVYNRRGHGKSDPLEGAHSVRFLHHEALRVLPQVLTHFTITRPILAGHSDGASIAILCAGGGLTPSALILEAPHVFVEDVTLTQITGMRERYATTDLRTKLARHHGPNVDTLFQYWTDIWLNPQFREWNIEEYLPRIACPVLVVQGKDDEHGTERQVAAVTAGLRGRRESVMLDDCRHAPHRDQRDTVEQLMTRFILGLRGPDR